MRVKWGHVVALQQRMTLGLDTGRTLHYREKAFSLSRMYVADQIRRRIPLPDAKSY
jgi:hypothetical protein